MELSQLINLIEVKFKNKWYNCWNYLYKPPDTSIVDFNKHMNDSQEMKIYNNGDFNIDLLTTDTNHQIADFIHNMLTHVQQLVNPP